MGSRALLKSLSIPPIAVIHSEGRVVTGMARHNSAHSYLGLWNTDVICSLGWKWNKEGEANIFILRNLL